MSDRWRKLLSEFDHLRPDDRVWHDAVDRAGRTADEAAFRGGRRRRPATVLAYGSILVAAVVLAAVVGRQTATTAERPPTAMDVEWPRILLSDLRVRIPIAEQLIRSNQCMTPQASFLTSPIYSDALVVRRTAPDPGMADIGARLTDVIAQCGIATRDGNGEVAPTTRNRFISQLRDLTRDAGSIAGAATSSSPAAWRDMLRVDLKTRIPRARVMIDNALCTAENNQALNNAISGDLNGYAILAASPPYLFMGVMREPMIALGARFQTLASQCFFKQRQGGLTTSERQQLRAELARIETELGRL
jgi:hypothetical protein